MCETWNAASGQREVMMYVLGCNPGHYSSSLIVATVSDTTLNRTTKTARNSATESEKMRRTNRESFVYSTDFLQIPFREGHHTIPTPNPRLFRFNLCSTLLNRQSISKFLGSSTEIRILEGFTGISADRRIGSVTNRYQFALFCAPSLLRASLCDEECLRKQFIAKTQSTRS